MRSQLMICAGFLICVFNNESVGALSLQDQHALALRFAPLIKTTSDANGNFEKYAPVNWDWFAQRSTLVSNYVSHHCAGTLGTKDKWPDGTTLIDFGATNSAANVNTDILKQPCADARNQVCFTTAGSNSSPGYALHMDNASDHSGEQWSDVIHKGHGVYAHVEEVDQTYAIINIEYTILWAYNDASCDHHEGDITTVVVDYDRQNDQLVRVTYSVHGYALEEFDLTHPSSLNLFYLSAQDEFHFDSSFLAAQLTFKPPYLSEKGGSKYHPSDPYLFLARDAASHRYEHPVVLVSTEATNFGLITPMEAYLSWVTTTASVSSSFQKRFKFLGQWVLP